MAKKYEYYYNTISKDIIRVLYDSPNLIQQYEFKIVAGINKGSWGYSCGYDCLKQTDKHIFGKLKALKILYGDKL